MSEEEVEMKTDAAMENTEMDRESEPELADEEDEMVAATSTADPLIPLQQQLTHIDQHYPPPNRPTPPVSFQSAGKKRKRLNESMTHTAVSPATLYRVALHSIFRFLNLKEFVRTCVINKTYYSAGQSMKPRNDELSYEAPIFLLVQSPLRIHISRLNLTHEVDPNELFLLQYRMGDLSHLKVEVKLKEDEWVTYSSPNCFAIPNQLESLEICFSFSPGCNLTTAMDVRNYLCESMKHVAEQSTYLEKLEVEIGTAYGEMAVPQALWALSTLTDLKLPSEFNIDQVIDLIKSLPNLRRWQPMVLLTPKLLQRLADGPTGPPQLEDIGALEYPAVDDAMAEQLIRIVTLTELDIHSMSLTDPTKLLPHFPHLSRLNLHCRDSVNLNQLVVALSTCVALTDLTLASHALTSDHLSQFLPHLNSLVHLALVDCVGLVSLRFLTTASRSLGHLRTFHINGSKQMPIKEYHHLHAISSSLEYLTIINSSIGRFDPLTIGRWTPRSEEFRVDDWPKLHSFHLHQKS